MLVCVGDSVCVGGGGEVGGGAPRIVKNLLFTNTSIILIGLVRVKCFRAHFPRVLFLTSSICLLRHALTSPLSFI